MAARQKPGSYESVWQRDPSALQAKKEEVTFNLSRAKKEEVTFNGSLENWKGIGQATKGGCEGGEGIHCWNFRFEGPLSGSCSTSSGLGGRISIDRTEMNSSAGEGDRSREGHAEDFGFKPKDKRKLLKTWRGSIWTWSDCICKRHSGCSVGNE